MTIRFVGLRKLGLPVALAMDLSGHDVMGFDLNPKVMQKETCAYLEQGPNGESSIEPFLRDSGLQFDSLPQLVQHSEVIFLAVQTPHGEKYEGITKLPEERVDFDYSYLTSAIAEVSNEISRARKALVLVVMSTVLPGTNRRNLVPLTNEYVRLCYNPSFIAMGTAIQDFLDREFVLLGENDHDPSPV